MQDCQKAESSCPFTYSYGATDSYIVGVVGHEVVKVGTAHARVVMGVNLLSGTGNGFLEGIIGLSRANTSFVSQLVAAKVIGAPAFTTCLDPGALAGRVTFGPRLPTNIKDFHPQVAARPSADVVQALGLDKLHLVSLKRVRLDPVGKNTTIVAISVSLGLPRPGRVPSPHAALSTCAS